MSKHQEPVMAIARLNARLQPIDRGDLFEDPLADRLEEDGLGEVTGGGTQLAPNGEVAYCDLELELQSADEATLRTVVECLEQIGAPKGSKLFVDESREIPFGTNEGLAVYLNGTDLPDSVYQECDINHVFEEFNRLLEDLGKVYGFWQGPTETALYLYGRSYPEMQERLEPFLKAYPLCQKSRVVQIA